MQEPYGEGPASHTDPESCVGNREAVGEALTGESTDQVMSCEINSSRVVTVLNAIYEVDLLGFSYGYPSCPDPAPVPKRALRRQALEVGALCGKAARTDLCGGPGATRVPTATLSCNFIAPPVGGLGHSMWGDRRGVCPLPALVRPWVDPRTPSRRCPHPWGNHPVLEAGLRCASGNAGWRCTIATAGTR
jgi:hypothetical protein